VLARRRGGRCGGVPASGVSWGSKHFPDAQRRRECAHVRAEGGGDWRGVIVCEQGVGGGPRVDVY